MLTEGPFFTLFFLLDHNRKLIFSCKPEISVRLDLLDLRLEGKKLRKLDLVTAQR